MKSLDAFKNDTGYFDVYDNFMGYFLTNAEMNRIATDSATANGDRRHTKKTIELLEKTYKCKIISVENPGMSPGNYEVLFL